MVIEVETDSLGQITVVEWVDGLQGSQIIVTGSDGGTLALVDLKGGGVQLEDVRMVDPTRGHSRVTFDGASAEPLGGAGEGGSLTARIYDRAAGRGGQPVRT